MNDYYNKCLDFQDKLKMYASNISYQNTFKQLNKVITNNK